MATFWMFEPMHSLIMTDDSNTNSSADSNINQGFLNFMISQLQLSKSSSIDISFNGILRRINHLLNVRQNRSIPPSIFRRGRNISIFITILIKLNRPKRSNPNKINLLILSKCIFNILHNLIQCLFRFILNTATNLFNQHKLYQTTIFIKLWFTKCNVVVCAT